MNISIDELSKDEYREIFKVIEVIHLRNLVISNKKLVQKIKGYRPDKTPPHELARIYFAEILIGNSELKGAFTDAVTSWMESVLQETTIGEESGITLVDAANIGTALATIDLQIDFRLFAKILCWDLSREEFQVMEQVYDRLRPIIIAQETKIEELQSQNQVASGTIQTNEERIRRLQESSDRYKLKANDEKKKREGVELDLENAIGDVRDLQSTIAELQEELGKNKEQIQFLKSDAKKKENQIKELNTSISSINEEKNAIVEKNKALETQKEFEFEQLIFRLANETISDLKIEFDLSKEELQKVVEDIDGPRDIVNIWKNMSEVNQGVIEDIEVNMKRNIASMEIIDMCDQAENYILVKYIILKAIKAIVFEKMSRQEKQESITSHFQK